MSALPSHLLLDLTGKPSTLVSVSDAVHFTVYGKPVPQGSHKAFIPKGWNRAVITADNRGLRSWRQEMTHAAQALNAPMIPRPRAVGMLITFYLARPASTPKRITRPTKKPDIDKLLRAVLDSLTGVLFEDDSQVVDPHPRKFFADAGTAERVEISLWEIPQ